jgi:hypothetical protein
MSIDVRGDGTRVPPLIPGAYEHGALTDAQPGSMGGPPFPSANVPIGPSSMDAATIAEREKEGGGALSQRRKVDVQPRANRAPTDAERNGSRMTRGYSWRQILRLFRR